MSPKIENQLWNYVYRQFREITYKGINLQEKGWEFRLDNAKSRFGVCKPKKKLISLSKHLVAANVENNRDKIKDTVLHEMAHAIDFELRGTSDHSRAWKTVCVAIGAEPTRCYSSKNTNIPKGKYTIKCDSCGTESQRHRMKRNYRASCAKCAPRKFDEKYLLRVIKNY